MSDDGVTVLQLGGVERAIAAYRAAGGVVDYTLVDVERDVDETTAHLSAACSMIRESARRSTIDGMRLHEFTIDRKAARFELINGVELAGPYYDWDRATLVSAWEGTVRHGVQPDGPMTHGYADAFSDPPYRLRAPLEQANAWFHAINEGTFGPLAPGLSVYRWSTNWSDYFDPGHEWWGAFCWTIRRPGTSLVTAIGAATTD